MDETHIGIFMHSLAVKEYAFAGFAMKLLLFPAGEAIPFSDMLRAACTAGEI